MSEKKKVHWSKSVLELIIIWQLLPFAFFSSSCIIYRLAFSHRQFHCLNHRKTDEEKNQFLFYLQATTAPECWMCKQWPELFSLPRSLSRQHVYYFLPWRKQERESERKKLVRMSKCFHHRPVWFRLSEIFFSLSLSLCRRRSFLQCSVFWHFMKIFFSPSSFSTVSLSLSYIKRIKLWAVLASLLSWGLSNKKMTKRKSNEVQLNKCISISPN